MLLINMEGNELVSIQDVDVLSLSTISKWRHANFVVIDLCLTQRDRIYSSEATLISELTDSSELSFSLYLLWFLKPVEIVIVVSLERELKFVISLGVPSIISTVKGLNRIFSLNYHDRFITVPDVSTFHYLIWPKCHPSCETCCGE